LHQVSLISSSTKKSLHWRNEQLLSPRLGTNLVTSVGDATEFSRFGCTLPEAHWL